MCLCCKKGIKGELWDLITYIKWWDTWVAMILAVMAGILSIKYDKSVIELNDWITSTNGILTTTNIIGISILFFAILFGLIICDIVTNFHDKKKQKNFKQLLYHVKYHCIGYFIFYIIAIFSFFIDAQETMYSIGLGYSIVSILFGMLMTNLCSYFNISLWDKLTSVSNKNCEFYIKIGLVLLATDYNTIFSFGLPGLMVSWLVPPFVLIFMFYAGSRCIKIRNLPYVMAISAGACICGVSAIAAVAPIVELNEEDMALAMAILSFFTILYMIVSPYICILFNIAMDTCGAWIGGAVDGTGRVVASVAVLDDEIAYETAVLVKMSQNMLIGFVCLFVAMTWDKLVRVEQKHLLIPKKSSHAGHAGYHKTDSFDYTDSIHDMTLQNTINNETLNNQSLIYMVPVSTNQKNRKPSEIRKPSNARPSHMRPKKQSIVANALENDESVCEFLWKKFPKFIIGYLVLSLIITVFINPYTSDEYSSNFSSNIQSLSKWLFCIGFVGIGSNTKFGKLWESIRDGKCIALYLVGQTFDTILTLFVAWIVFTYIV